MAQSKVGMLKKVVVGLSVIIILTLIAMFGVSLAAGVALKDTKLGGEVGAYNKAMLSTDGSPVSVDVTETDLDLFELPKFIGAWGGLAGSIPVQGLCVEAQGKYPLFFPPLFFPDHVRSQSCSTAVRPLGPAVLTPISVGLS